MQIKDLVFDNNKLLNLNQSIEDLCLSCSALGILCSTCPADNTKKTLYDFASQNNIYFPLPKQFEILAGESNISFTELLFDKNKVIIAQNTLEDLCSNCAGSGILCFDCNVHEARRTLASLPVKDIDPMARKAKKKAAASGEAKSCGTSCSTGGCGTKK